MMSALSFFTLRRVSSVLIKETQVRTLLLIIATACFFVPGAAAGTKIGGVELPDVLTAGGEKLMLNGAGLRKKLWVKVYAGGLYVKTKSNDAQALVDADEPMIIRMHFIHDGVSKEKLTGAWNDGFKAATKGETAAIQNDIDAFNAMFTKEAKENDVYDVVYVPGDGVELLINGTSQGKVKAGMAFKKALFGIWLGDEPADSGLKKGMIGK